MTRFFIALLLFTLSPLTLTADTVVEEIVARVNNQIITHSDYLRERQQLKEEAQNQDPAHAEQLAAEHVREQLIADHGAFVCGY